MEEFVARCFESVDGLPQFVRSGSKLGADFRRAREPRIELQVDGTPLHLYQDTSDEAIGGVVWDCGVTLCQVVSDLYHCVGDLEFQNLNVLELGSGTGVAGIFSAKLLGSRGVLTDKKSALELLSKNVEQNGLGNRILVQEYNWGVDPVPRPAEGGAFNVILCSDVIYDEASHGALVWSLEKLMTSRTLVLLAVKVREPRCEASFFAALDTTFGGKMKISAYMEQPFACKGIYIYALRRAPESPVSS